MSDTAHKKIIEGLKTLGKGNKPHANAIIEAKVKSVSNDNLVLCEADGLDIPDVQLRAIIDGNNLGILVVPKANTYVLIGSIEGRQEYIVLNVQEAEKILIKVGNITLDILSTVIKLNGDTHGGLTKIQSLTTKINTIENKVNAILSALQAVVVPLAPSGTYPFAPLFSPITALTNTLQSDIENTKVKHG